MKEENVAIRLKGFIDSEGLTHSQFADKCEIPRPSLSQLLSGRNKKISDVLVGQIHRAFPLLSVTWLLFGEGPMLLPVSGALPVSSGSKGADSEQNPVSGALLSDDNYKSNSLFDLTYSEPETYDASHGSGNSSNGYPRTADRSVNSNSRLERRDSSFDSQKFSGEESDQFENSNLNALTTHAKALQIAEKQLVDAENKIEELQSQIDKIRANPRKVTHITVYYDDSTFETFYPRSSNLV